MPARTFKANSEWRAAGLTGAGGREAQYANLMLALFAVEDQKFDPARLEAFDERCRTLLASVHTASA